MIKIEIQTPKVHGFFALDNGGKNCVGKGGLRLLPDVSMQEIERLARVMTKKCRYYNLPYTGAKAGIVWDGKGGEKRKRELIKEFFNQLKFLNLI